ncbi:uncharacterized protein LOC114942996 [Nylanderia fulva]|uniref:uncharacterized protein LOC114942996 n=1 Tax=Nylanderia fulva TaxID=613905 RepID=UPI0010FB2C90|nr:uncharacterized protein LOC114942996 [Nylanderia fulva]
MIILQLRVSLRTVSSPFVLSDRDEKEEFKVSVFFLHRLQPACTRSTSHYACTRVLAERGKTRKIHELSEEISSSANDRASIGKRDAVCISPHPGISSTASHERVAREIGNRNDKDAISKGALLLAIDRIEAKPAKERGRSCARGLRVSDGVRSAHVSAAISGTPSRGQDAPRVFPCVGVRRFFFRLGDSRVSACDVSDCIVVAREHAGVGLDVMHERVCGRVARQVRGHGECK